MIGTVMFQDQVAYDRYVSDQSKEYSQMMRQLLKEGLIQGRSTSITEADMIAPADVLSEQFRFLIETIKRECAHFSSAREVGQHPAYLQIIEMGPHALPLLLRELEERPDHWFLALREITQENPVLPEHRGIISEMTRDWLRWASDRGLKW